MYPGISDLINDFFGTSFSVSFPPTFGTLVAISFLFAAWTLAIELRRKEKLGLVQPVVRKMLVGTPARADELFWNGLFGFIIGYKILYAVLNPDEFFADPQKAILSVHGNLLGGLLFGALFVYLKYKEKKKQRLKEPRMEDVIVHPSQLVSEFTMAAAVGGLLGAKIFHILEYWDDFIADPAGMFFSGSGLTMYGGLIVGGLAVLWHGRRNNIHPLVLCDAAAPGLMLAYGTGRLGCQLSGDGDWGIVNAAPNPYGFLPDWAWSYNYPHNVINEGMRIPDCIGRHCYQLIEPVYPTPLYESVVCIAFFFLLWSMRKKLNLPGLLFSAYLILNGVERFFIEKIRINSKYHVAGISFSQAELISLLLLLGGILLAVYVRRRNRKKHDAT